jgi:glycosyltransferase involved in cell wall biosynthesis
MSRWLFFTWMYPPAPGGVEEIVRATAQGFAARGREVLVVTSATPDVGAGERVEDGVRVIRLEGLHPSDRAPVPEEELAATVEAFAPDVIHAHMLSYPWMPERSATVTRALRRSGETLLDQAHGGDPQQDAESCLRLMCGVDAVVCDSAYIRDVLVALADERGMREGLPPLHVVHPPTAPLDLFAPDARARAATRASLGFEDDDLVVFFPSRFFDVDGSLSERKRPGVAVDAFVRCAEAVPRARFLAVRSPGFWTADSERAARAEIDERLGDRRARAVMLDRRVSRREMAELYRAADVTLVPSIEGFGLVYVESIACGTPVVAIDEGAAREVLGEDAALVDPELPVADRLAGALAELATDPARRAALSAAGRERAERCYDPSTWLDGLDSVLLVLNA